jgi:hypothetical protein
VRAALKCLLAVCSLLGVLLGSVTGRAAPPAPPSLTLSAEPVLGPGGPLPEGWSTYAVWLANAGGG